MHFTIDRSALLAALSQTVPVAMSTSQLPILSHVRLETIANGLLIEANNLETAVRVETVCEVDVGQAFSTICAPAKRLHEVVKSCPAGQIVFTLGDAMRLKISAGNASFSVACLDSADWPQMSVPTGTQEGTHDAGVLARALEDVAFAASDDASRFNLMAIHIEPTDTGIRLTATDGHRLARCEIRGVVAFPEGRRLALLPNSASFHLVKLLRNVAGQIQLTLDEKNLFVAMPSTSASFRLVDGDYPNVAKVIPEETTITIPVHRSALMDAIGRANLFTNERSVGVDVVIDANQLRVSSQNVDTGEGSDSVEVAYDAEPVSFLVNGNYFAEALRHIGTETVNLLFVGAEMEGTPFLLKPENMSVCKEGDTPVDMSGGVAYFNLVMPMKR